MNPFQVKTGCAVFILMVMFCCPVKADDERVTPAGIQAHLKIVPRVEKDREMNEELPPADRPDNNVTEMSKEAREQYDRNEKENRKKLKEHRQHKDEDRDDRDHHDQDDHPKPKLRKFTPGGYVTQVFPDTVNGSVYRKDIPGERRKRDTRRNYHFDYNSRVYVYESNVIYVPVVMPPAGYESLTFGGILYYYDEGRFYVPTNGQLLEVHPPIGAVVRRLPDGHVTIEEERDIYYVYDGVFYRQVKGGYEVMVPPFDPEEANRDVPLSRTVIVHLPGERGRDIEVVLARNGHGFSGPQGEFYPEFPPVEQLKEMYAERD